jgi:hypothetical protein
LPRPFTGIARYLSSILCDLAKIDGENAYYLYSDRDFPCTAGAMARAVVERWLVNVDRIWRLRENASRREPGADRQGG